MTTATAARDQMFGVFKSYWDTTGYSVVWSDTPGDPPVAAEPWARVVARHATGAQTALANGTGSTLHTHTGTLWIQLFVPLGQGESVGLALAQQVLDAYRAARGDVWYRNHRFREAGNSGAYSLINCLIDFTYDQ